jgi:hypothetical protein
MRIAHKTATITDLATVRGNVPADVAEVLADLDTEHDAACDIYDIATREMDAARETLADATAALRAAEVTWAHAGAEMNSAAVAVSRARKAAGVVLTADGYRPVTA